MAQSRGKKFETLFRDDWTTTVPDSMCYRLIDAMGGYKSVVNAGDFINYKYPYVYIIDCKSSDSNTFPVTFRQYDEMIKYNKTTGVKVGVIWWSIPNDKVVWIPVETFTKLREDGKKSFNIKMLGDDTYFSLEIPSKKMRTFMHSDYSALVDYYKE